jgi:hypothetical protein
VLASSRRVNGRGAERFLFARVSHVSSHDMFISMREEMMMIRQQNKTAESTKGSTLLFIKPPNKSRTQVSSPVYYQAIITSLFSQFSPRPYLLLKRYPRRLFSLPTSSASLHLPRYFTIHVQCNPENRGHSWVSIRPMHKTAQVQTFKIRPNLNPNFHLALSWKHMVALVNFHICSQKIGVN